ncbi:thialysine N-epsilon-acetyltransferase-like isoform X3 [Mytilus trossulus]|uniref:thialysine N-epsilon-acetyltransferase-like isoform X3 n=1 Tax=Mytilus trossulus TaxID=6551 RepID=UPI003006734D
MEANEYTVRPANYEDCEAIMSLVMELAVHVKREDEVKIKADTLRRDGFGKHSLFHCLVAEVNKDMVGYLLYYFTYSPWVGKKAFMEDFYVKPEHRNKGIGTELLKSAAKVFLDTHCNSMEWAVRWWNKVAVDFYKQKGAINLTETEQFHILRLTEESMQNLLTK